MTDEKPDGWLGRLKGGLSRSSEKLSTGIAAILTKRRLDAGTVEALEDVLIAGDLGVATASRLAREIAAERFERDADPARVRAALAENIAAILEPVAAPLVLDATRKPHVVLVCGVNGSGKTTTIGKLANQFRDDGKRVVIAACDTFRAAAVEQLRIWGERAGCPVIEGADGADPAGLAFDALQQARDGAADVLMIDTAGRLQNRKDLMEELRKVVRVIRKLDDSAPHSVVLVMDATIGQNAHSQVETFKEMVDVSGLIVTKLDGSAKGGVVVGLAETFGLPIHAVGVGEGIDDLRPFEAGAFARTLMGVEAGR